MSYAPQSSPGPFRLPACAVRSHPLRHLPLALLVIGAVGVPSAMRAQAPDSVVAATAAGASDPTASTDRIETVKQTPVHGAPDGPAVGSLQSGARARVLGRANGWTRVQVEGWVHDADVRADTASALSGVTVAQVHGEPDRYVGRTVDWRLQLIAVQTADELRPEMIAGQPYLLTRGPLPEAGFVYVTVTKAQADRLRALPPLQEMVLRVTIRAARSRYLDTPLVDLVSVVSGGQVGTR